jgi:hypothetical protein
MYDSKGLNMAKKVEQTGASSESGDIVVDSAVVVYPGTDREQRGVIVEDFGDSAGQSVDIADNHIADPARRWAVRTDSGELLFVDDENLAAT